VWKIRLIAIYIQVCSIKNLSNEKNKIAFPKNTYAHFIVDVDDAACRLYTEKKSSTHSTQDKKNRLKWIRNESGLAWEENKVSILAKGKWHWKLIIADLSVNSVYSTLELVSTINMLCKQFPSGPQFIFHLILTASKPLQAL